MTTTLDSTLVNVSIDQPLRGTVALVTGGGRGIGRFIARALGEAGASVALIARSRDQLDETADIIRSTGGTAAVAVPDVADAKELTVAITQLDRKLGPFDLLVNNAAIIGPVGPLWEVDANEWWSAMDVNLRGVVLASHAVLPRMVDRRRGRIINITCQAGAHRRPLVSAYSVSKASVIKLTENLAHETAAFGVKVFSVHPGLLATDLSDGGAEPGAAIDLVMRIAKGEADTLSGRHLSVHDDLDAVVARAGEVEERDLYVMRPERLDDNLAAPARRASHGWAMSVIGAGRGFRA